MDTVVQPLSVLFWVAWALVVFVIFPWFTVPLFFYTYIQHDSERTMPGASLHCLGPLTVSRLHGVQPLLQWVTIAVVVATLLVAIANFVPFSASDTVGGFPGSSALLMILIPFAFTASILFILFSVRDHSLVCPHCHHEIPLSTHWICPYKNCGEQNSSYYRKPKAPLPTDEAMLPLLGNSCTSCKQTPSGFICTACRKPMYFTKDTARHRIDLCARTVGFDVTEIEEKTEQEIPRDVGEITAAVEKIAAIARDAMAAENLFNTLLADQKGKLSPEDFKMFSETAMDLYHKAKRNITGHRH